MLSAGELRDSQRRLESRAKEATERAKQKADKERLLAERQAARQAARDEEARQKRLAQLAAEEEERRLFAAELEANNGVLYRAELLAVPAPESIAADKGIRRAADKILLPPSAGSSLLSQDASKNGPMYFHLATPSGTATHAGLLEFSGAEGFVALPLKVIRSLWGPNATEEDCAGRLHVAYRRLPKGGRVVFQPRSATFQQEVGEDIREVLEAALLQHSCLTRGDWLAVRHGEQQYDLRVCDLQPEAAVSVIDTDLEADINPSIETEERIREEYEAASQRAAAAAAAAAAAVRQQQEAEVAAEEAAARQEAVRLAKEAALPAEPAPDCGQPLASCLFRLPDGARLSRRFLLSSPMQLLFDFVDSKGASGWAPGSYSLVSQYPRRVFAPPHGPGLAAARTAAAAGAAAGAAGGGPVTLQAAGLTGPREVLFLEPRSSAADGGGGGGSASAGASEAAAAATAAASVQ